MSDTPRTDAEECDSFIGINSYFDADDVHRGYGFARQLERELTAAQAEIARLKGGGCARDQRTTQFCGEALKLQEENAKLQERVRRLEEALYVYLQAGHKQARREASVIAKAALAKGTQ